MRLLDRSETISPSVVKYRLGPSGIAYGTRQDINVIDNLGVSRIRRILWFVDQFQADDRRVILVR